MPITNESMRAREIRLRQELQDAKAAHNMARINYATGGQSGIPGDSLRQRVLETLNNLKNKNQELESHIQDQAAGVVSPSSDNPFTADARQNYIEWQRKRAADQNVGRRLADMEWRGRNIPGWKNSDSERAVVESNAADWQQGRPPHDEFAPRSLYPTPSQIVQRGGMADSNAQMLQTMGEMGGSMQDLLRPNPRYNPQINNPYAQ